MRKKYKPDLGTPVETYKSILQGKICKFPSGFFTYDVDREASREIVRYFISDIMQFNTREDILKKLRKNDFHKNKLAGLLTRVYRDSPSRAVMDAFPEHKMHVWEFDEAQNNFWKGEEGKKNGKEAIHWLFYEKLKLRDKDIPGQFTWAVFEENGLGGAIKRAFNTSLQECANYCFPGLFPEWALLTHVPNGYWTKERSIYALKWTLEDKLHLTRSEITKYYSRTFLVEHNLYGMVQRCFGSDMFKALDAAYPGEFLPWELSVGPGFWNRERAVLAMKWCIEEMEKIPGWTIENNLSYRTLKDKGLYAVGETYELTDLLNEVRPGYKTFHLKAYSPNGYWNWQNTKEALQWLIEERLQISYEDALRLRNKHLMENGLGGLVKWTKMTVPALIKKLFPEKIGEI